jgi:LysM repeat protein
VNSTGGDLVDQLREWFDRMRERLGGRSGGAAAARPVGERSGRRATMRSQAVPLGSYQARTVAARRQFDRRGGATGRAYRAERGAYTLVFAAVLIALAIGLFFALSWLLGVGGPSGSSQPATAGSAAAPNQLPSPAPVSSPPPFLVTPSPSPSPDSGLAVASPSARVHVIEAGDTLNRISQRYGVTVDAIMQANNFTDRGRILRIGERLVIPEPPAGSPIPR